MTKNDQDYIDNRLPIQKHLSDIIHESFNFRLLLNNFTDHYECEGTKGYEEFIKKFDRDIKSIRKKLVKFEVDTVNWWDKWC
jgi:hypothetical protein